MLTIAAFALSLLTAGSYSADDKQYLRSETVRTADLDLAKPEGRRALDDRLKAAARRVCEIGDDRDPYVQTQEHYCRAEAVAQARDQITQSASLTVSEARRR